jgi:hypothetical protein
MKILYMASERHDAQLAASASRSLAQDVAVDWAGRRSDPRLRVSESPSLTAAVVEAQVQHEGCAALVGLPRRLGMTTSNDAFRALLFGLDRGLREHAHGADSAPPEDRTAAQEK